MHDFDPTGLWMTFHLPDLPEGNHLVFALAGMASGVFAALQDPYNLQFRPMALGIVRIDVLPGDVPTTVDIPLTIDLTPLQADGATPLPEDVTISLGPDTTSSPAPLDPLTSLALPNRLVMPVLDTGGDGFIFVSVDGSYDVQPQGDCEVQPRIPPVVRFPAADDPTLVALGITSINRLAVGLAGRASYAGRDPPGISTPVRPGVLPGDVVDFGTADKWLDVPVITTPPRPWCGGPAALPADSLACSIPGHGPPLDTPSPTSFGGHVEWSAISNPRSPDLWVLRVNYLTAPPANMYPTISDKAGNVLVPGALGGAKSHCLWELFAPPGTTHVDLPVFPADAPVLPLVGNPAPDDGTLPDHYAADDVELELNAYLLGASGKAYDYNTDFAYSDVNLSCAVVSQDSFVVKVDPAAPWGK
jgi:hypothetical protein